MSASTELVVSAVATLVTSVSPLCVTVTVLVFVELLPVVSFEVLPVTVVEPAVGPTLEPLLAELITPVPAAMEPDVRLPAVVFWLELLLPVSASTYEEEVNVATLVVVESPLAVTAVVFVFVELAPVRWFVDVLFTVTVGLTAARILASLLAQLLIALQAVMSPEVRLPAVVFLFWLLSPVSASSIKLFTIVATLVKVMSPLNVIVPVFVLVELKPVVSLVKVPLRLISPYPKSMAPALSIESHAVVPLIIPEVSEPPVVFLLWLLLPVSTNAEAALTAVATLVSVVSPDSVMP